MLWITVAACELPGVSTTPGYRAEDRRPESDASTSERRNRKKRPPAYRLPPVENVTITISGRAVLVYYNEPGPDCLKRSASARCNGSGEI